MRSLRWLSAGLGAAVCLFPLAAQARQTDPAYTEESAEGPPALYGGDPYAGPSYYAPSAPADEDEGFEMPPVSIRIDPFNWLLEGHLGVELEVGVWKFITAEMVPLFVVNREPPMLNLRSREHRLEQNSNGWGPLAGASIGAGFWLNGTPFRGYVLRALFTNYGYTYQTSDSVGLVDEVSHTQRRFVGMLGSQSRFGAFSIGWGFGLGVELNRKSRCYPAGSLTLGDVVEGDSSRCGDDMEIAVNRSVSSVVDLNGWAHPVYVMFRLSLGATFD